MLWTHLYLICYNGQQCQVILYNSKAPAGKPLGIAGVV